MTDNADTFAAVLCEAAADVRVDAGAGCGGSYDCTLRMKCRVGNDDGIERNTLSRGRDVPVLGFNNTVTLSHVSCSIASVCSSVCLVHLHRALAGLAMHACSR